MSRIVTLVVTTLVVALPATLTTAAIAQTHV